MNDMTHNHPPAPNPSETMPGRNLHNGDEAARISDMIDAELKVRFLNSFVSSFE
jgi:hypothetical protein